MHHMCGFMHHMHVAKGHFIVFPYLSILSMVINGIIISPDVTGMMYNFIIHVGALTPLETYYRRTRRKQNSNERLTLCCVYHSPIVTRAFKGSHHRAGDPTPIEIPPLRLHHLTIHQRFVNLRKMMSCSHSPYSR